MPVTAYIDMADHLSALPFKVLNLIFLHSREPCLIHACKTLYQKLPPFVHYTQTLLKVAYGSWSTSLNDLRTLHGFHPAPWTQQDCEALQRQIGQSKWLRCHHLVKTYTACKKLALEDCLGCIMWQRGCSHELWRRAVALLDGIPQMTDVEFVGACKLPIRTPNGVLKLTLTVSHSGLALEDQKKPALAAARPIILATYLPDCVLRAGWLPMAKCMRSKFMSSSAFPPLTNEQAQARLRAGVMPYQLDFNSAWLSGEITTLLFMLSVPTTSRQAVTSRVASIREVLLLAQFCRQETVNTKAILQICVQSNLSACLDLFCQDCVDIWFENRKWHFNLVYSHGVSALYRRTDIAWSDLECAWEYATVAPPDRRRCAFVLAKAMLSWKL